MEQIKASIEDHTKIHHFFPLESIQICAIIDIIRSNITNDEADHSNQLPLALFNELQSSVLLRFQSIYKELERLTSEECKSLDGVKRFIEFIGSNRLNQVR